MPDNNDRDIDMKKEEREKRLLDMRRARNRLFVCFWTFPVYVLAVTQVLDSGNGTTPIMLAYMLLYAWFGMNLAIKRCPDCHQQFFVKSFFLNPFPKQCAHCGISLKHSE